MITAALLDQLTRREHQVLALMAEGRSNGAIGEQLTVEVKTVEPTAAGSSPSPT